MNREILFKAKAKLIVGTYNSGKEDGEWVTGFVYCDIGKWIIRQFEYDRADYICYEIDPETLCQYTGLTDKNGNKIWENDILYVIEKTGNNVYQNGVMVGQPRWINKFNFKVEYTPGGLMNTQRFANAPEIECEVIGNIFDNADLLNE